jgi:predicted 3-demethylubiquinone-9 3-methyltransferase (glyoxalase superfamily)
MPLAKRQIRLSCQIVPMALVEMLQDKDSKKSQRVMKALMHMKKLDVPTLQKAYEQGD